MPKIYIYETFVDPSTYAQLHITAKILLQSHQYVHSDIP